MTKDEARNILAEALPAGDSVDDCLHKIRAAIEKNDRITNSITENVLLDPWSKALKISPSKLVTILIALEVL
ncbi:MAG: hypothetical protein H7249_03945 [Chitinophagaceae bacterium]|nr:hypothetical protein [Oligoflexus sp.]